MSKTLYSIISDADVLLDLEPEELAGSVLEVLNSLEPSERGQLNRYSFTLDSNLTSYPPGRRKEIAKAVTEAWVWLEHEGLVAPQPGSIGEWVFVTRRGQRLKGTTDLSAYRNANLLPKKILHPIIAEKVWSIFTRGEYETAVFQAFKAVEVSVRTTGNFDMTDLGTDLMRKAFDPKSGPLTDDKQPKAEREALAHLFAGSIGLFKNPHSHRNEPITDPIEAVEMIFLASHLLRIVDARAQINPTAS